MNAAAAMFFPVLVLIGLGQWSHAVSDYVPILDEAQLILQGKMLVQGKIPWLGIDFTTSGPLNSVPLVVAALFSGKELFVARLTGIGFNALIICILFAGFRSRFGPARATVAILPLLILFALHRSPVLQGYHTGLVPSLLFALAYLGDGARYHSLLLGLSVITKIQTAPSALLLVFSEKRVLRSLALFAVPAGLMLLVFLLGGEPGDFILTQIRMPLAFDAGFFVPPKMLPVWDGDYKNFLYQSGWNVLFIASAFLGGLGFLKPGRKSLSLWVLSAFAGIGSVLFTGTFLPHYLGVFIVPFFITGVIGATRFGKASVWILGSLSVLVILSLALFPQEISPLTNRLSERHSLVKKLKSTIPQKERMYLYGWAPEVFLLTNTVPATRDSIAQFSMFPSSVRGDYRQRVLRELSNDPPPFILDLSCAHPGFRIRCQDMSFPELDSFLSAYELVLSETEPIPVKLWKKRKTQKI